MAPFLIEVKRLQEKFKYLRKAEEQDIAYMQSMPFSLSIPSHGCIVAHAGLVPGFPLQEQDLYDLIEASSLCISKKITKAKAAKALRIEQNKCQH